MGHFRRIFTAPGNVRIWFSLAIYVSALVALLVYRDKIGQTVSRAFTEATRALPAKPPAVIRPDANEVAARRAALLPGGRREEQLLALARAGNRPALLELAKIVKRRPADGRVSDALRLDATSALEEMPPLLRSVAAGLLLWAEGARPTANTVRLAIKQLGAKRPEAVRLGGLRRLGLLALVGVRSKPAERIVITALGSRAPRLRAAAARAAGRFHSGAALAPLFRLVDEKQPRLVRQAALAGLVDLGLSGARLRSEVLRLLAARLAGKDLRSNLAEEIWRTLRRLAGNSTPARIRKKSK